MPLARPTDTLGKGRVVDCPETSVPELVQAALGGSRPAWDDLVQRFTPPGALDHVSLQTDAPRCRGCLPNRVAAGRPASCRRPRAWRTPRVDRDHGAPRMRTAAPDPTTHD